MIKHEELLKLLSYNKDTGVFIWKEKPCRNIKIGDVAGCVDTQGYISIGVRGVKYKAHRLAWFYVNGVHPVVIDHINGDKKDNRICNLRSCTQSENLLNQSIRVNNSSGAKGVSWHKQSRSWKVTIPINRKAVCLGYFKDLELSTLIAEEARDKFHGEFCRN